MQKNTMKVQAVLSPFLLLVGVSTAADIRICVEYKEAGVVVPVAADVQCWDEDKITAKQAMTVTSSTTLPGGCTTLTYTKKWPKLYNLCNGWDCFPFQNPDIYCEVKKSGDYTDTYTNTKMNKNQNIVADFGTVTIFPDRVARGDAGSINGCGPASFWQPINDVTTCLIGFGDACNNHDLCYDNCNETKKDCDMEFRDMMYSKCHDHHDTMSGTIICKSVAKKMYALVRTFGSDSYNNKQQNNGC
jgi:hypothetical protein